MPGKRVTIAEIDDRVDLIVPLLVVGLARKDIHKYIKSRENWGVCVRSVDGYIRKAKNQIKRAAKYNRQHELGLSILRKEELFKRCINGGDYKTASLILRDKDDLLGLKEGKDDNSMQDITINVAIVK